MKKFNPKNAATANKTDANGIKEEMDLPELWGECLAEFTLRSNDKQNDHSKIGWNDFDHIKVLGEGGFGKVILSREKRTKNFMATKLMEKSFIVKMKQIHLATNERYLLYLCKFKFILALLNWYQTNDYVCICLELAPGGDLFDLMENTLPFDVPTTRFYGSQVILGLQYMNTVKVVYRDLKPENILIAGNGYVKIADLGFAKMLSKNPRTYTFCGTPEYIAPEIVLNKGYGLAVDWWSFGVMLYEMLVGTTPFYSEDQMKTFKYITRGAYGIPHTLPDDAKSIIKHLLQVDVTRRYGNLKSGALDIRYHPFFLSVDWCGIYEQNLKPPFPVNNPDFAKMSKSDDIEKIRDFSATNQYAKEFANF